MKNKTLYIALILLVFSVGNAIRIFAAGNIRAVDFVSIFVMGVLCGIAGIELLRLLKKREQNRPH